MKMTKRIVSVFLAALMAFGCFSLAASAAAGSVTVDFEYYRAVVKDSVTTWERITADNNKVGRGDVIKARLFVDADYAVGVQRNFWMYTEGFMAIDTTNMTETTAGNGQWKTTPNPNTESAAYAAGYGYITTFGTEHDEGLAGQLTDDGGGEWDPYIYPEEFVGYDWFCTDSNTGKSAQKLSSGSGDEKYADKYWVYELEFKISDGATGTGGIIAHEMAIKSPDNYESLSYILKQPAGVGGSYSSGLVGADVQEYNWNISALNEEELSVDNTVKFVDKDGSEIASYTGYINGPISDAKKFTVPTIDDDAFLGWSPDGGTTVYTTTASTEDPAEDPLYIGNFAVPYELATLTAVYDETEPPAPETYTVTFKHSADGEEITSIPDLASGAKIDAEEFTIAAEELVVPDGKEFAYWTLLDGTTKVDENYAITADITLIPYYTEVVPETYTVTFKHSADGEEITSVPGIESGAKIDAEEFAIAAEELVVPDGKEFAYWTLLDGTTKVDENYAITADITLIPHYEDITVNVTYKDSNGEDLDVYEGLEYGYELTADDLDAEAELLTGVEGKTFAYWTIDGVKVEPGYIVKENVTLVPYYIDNSYTVTFKHSADGEEIDNMAGLAHNYELTEDDLSIMAEELVPEAGKQFANWALEDGTDVLAGYKVTSDLVLVPEYSDIKYTVTFYADEAGTQVHEAQTDAYTYNGKLEYPATAPAAPAGKYFDGWSVDAGTAVTSNMSVTPIFTTYSYTVAFQNADGAEIDKIENVAYGTVLTAEQIAAAEDKLPSLENTGLKYTGWDGDVTAPVKAGVTFKATTEKESYTVKFVTGIDGETVADLPVAFDDNITLEQLSVEGLNFKGWVTDLDTKAPAATKIADLGDDGATVTYYAYWTKTVTFVDGETETTVEVDKDASILAKAPEFAGNGDDYEAGVWNTAADGSGDALTANAVATADATATYYAYYAPKGSIAYTIEIYEEVLNKDGEYALAETIEVKDGVAGDAIEYNEARKGFKNPTLDTTAATVVASGAVAKVKYERIDDITITVDGKPDDYEYGEELNPAVPETEDGKEFDKWVDADGNEVQVPTTVTPDMDNLELIAKYKYVITFIDQGETTKNDAQAEGAVIEAPAEKGKADYAFAGWFTAENGAGEELADGAVVTGVATYYAYYAPKGSIAYTIEIYEEVLNKDGEYALAETIEVKDGVAGDAIEYNEARKGFKNPVLDPAGATVVASGAVAKVKYERIDDITITVDGKPDDYEYGEELNPAVPETEDGKEFDKWVDADGNEVQVPTTVTPEMDNLELIAKYKYVITFIDQGETTKNDAQAEGAVIEAPAEKGKADYAFAGWFTAENGAGEELADGAVVTGAATYYAHYEAKTDISYIIAIYEEKLTADKVEGEDEYVFVENVPVENAKAGEAVVYTTARKGFKAPVLDPADAVVANGITVKAYYDRIDDITITVDGKPDDYEYGEELNPAVPETEDGKEFDKWVDADGNEVQVPTTVKPDMDNLELIAKYKYVITFIVDGEPVKDDAQAEGTAIVAPADPGIKGYAFGGWFTAENGAGEKLADGAVVTGVATYYAKLTLVKNTLTFTDADGNVIGTPVEVEYGAKLSDIAPAAPEVNGMTFAGWVDVVTGLPMPETMPDVAATYKPSYAGNGTTKYTVETYFMDVNGNYTSKTVTTSEATLGTKVTVEDKSDENVGYYLDTEKSIMSIDKLVTGTVLKAYYAREEVTVTFVDYDGITVLGTYTGLYGSKIEYPADPTREFHTFAGWDSEPTTAPVGDITIKATYERVPVVLVNNKTTEEGLNVVFNRDDENMMYIHGFMTNDIKNQADYDRYLAVEGDGYFKVVPVANGKYGTGTKIELYDNYDGALLETYYIVIFGDVDGNADVDSNDISIVRDEAMRKTHWSNVNYENEYNAIRVLAADLVQSNGTIAANDTAAVTAHVTTAAEINQTTREVIYNS